MAASDLYAVQAALLLPPECLGEVRRRAISRTPIPDLLGGLLSKNEGGQLSLRPRLPLKRWEHCLRPSKSRGRHRFGHLIHSESLLLHLQGKPFVNTPSRLLWELRHSHASGINRAGWHVMGLSEFPAVSSTFSSDKTLISAFSSWPGYDRPPEQFPESS
jgi:hypothetical protein